MKAPNVVSIAAIVGIIALCQGLAETLPVLGQPWVPFAIVALGALVKGLQVCLEAQKAANPEARAVNEAQPQPGKVRRWLLD